MREKLRVYRLLSWYKKLKEEQIQSQVARLKKELNDLQEKKAEVVWEREKRYQELSKKRKMTAEELRGFFSDIEALKNLEQQIVKNIEFKAKELENTSKTLIEAYKQRRLMETLTKKTEDLWRFEETKRFYKELDDLVVLRYKKG